MKSPTRLSKNSAIKLILGIGMLSTFGCATTTQSRIPGFLERARNLQFNREQKVFVGEILHYANDLERTKK